MCDIPEIPCYFNNKYWLKYDRTNHRPQLPRYNEYADLTFENSSIKNYLRLNPLSYRDDNLEDLSDRYLVYDKDPATIIYIYHSFEDPTFTESENLTYDTSFSMLDSYYRFYQDKLYTIKIYKDNLIGKLDKDE